MNQAEVKRTKNYYRSVNPHCELLPVFLLAKPLTGFFDKLELHHIAGRGKGCETHANYIIVCEPVHAWLTDNSKPGFVLCAYIKTVKNEADWDTWTALKTIYRPSGLESDDCIEACKPWPFIDDMRQILIQGAT